MSGLLKAELYKQICIIKNNKFKYFSGIILNIIILIGIISFNIKSSYNEVFFIVAWYSIIWLIFSGLTQTHNIVSSETKNNTIYKLMASPHGIKKIILSKILINGLLSVSIITIILFIVEVLYSNIDLSLLIQFGLIAFIGLISINSIGIILGFLSIISPNINLITTILRVLIILSMIEFKFNIFIPFSYAKEMILDLLFLNKNIWDYPIEFILCFILNSIIYIIISIFISKYLEKMYLEKGKFFA